MQSEEARQKQHHRSCRSLCAGSGHDWCQALSLTSLLLQQLRSPDQQMLSQILNDIIYPGIAQSLPHARCSPQKPTLTPFHQLHQRCHATVSRPISRPTNLHATLRDSLSFYLGCPRPVMLSCTQPCRAAAFRCLGLFSLVSMSGFRVSCEPAMEQCLPVSLLRAGLADPKHAVRLEAAKGLCDLAAARQAPRRCCHLASAEPHSCEGSPRDVTDSGPMWHCLHLPAFRGLFARRTHASRASGDPRQSTPATPT